MYNIFEKLGESGLLVPKVNSMRDKVVMNMAKFTATNF